MSGLVDLDMLVLRCRDEQARDYIREAVACYKANAFRACIVATSNPVVFDYLHKLRELDLTGDKNARQKLQEFEKIRAGGEKQLKKAMERLVSKPVWPDLTELWAKLSTESIFNVIEGTETPEQALGAAAAAFR